MRQTNTACDCCGTVLTGTDKTGYPVEKNHIVIRGLMMYHKYDEGYHSFTYITKKSEYGMSELHVCDLDCLEDLMEKREREFQERKGNVTTAYHPKKYAQK